MSGAPSAKRARNLSGRGVWILELNIRRFGHIPQVLRPIRVEAEPEQPEILKKLAERVEALREAYPKASLPNEELPDLDPGEPQARENSASSPRELEVPIITCRRLPVCCSRRHRTHRLSASCASSARPDTSSSAMRQCSHGGFRHAPASSSLPVGAE
jgi:hypothetical protein